MNENGPHEERDAIGQLIARAGVAEPLDELMQRRVRRQVEQAMIDANRQRRRRRLWTRAVAASLITVVALWAGLGQRPPEQPLSAQLVGKVLIVRGQPQSNQKSLVVNDTLVVGDTIETDGKSLISIELGAGRSLRLASDSRVRLEANERLTLMAGQLYVDAEPGIRAPGLIVDTQYGSVREIGTQFMVKTVDQGIVVSVREGRIELNRSGVIHDADVGTRLQVVAGRPDVKRGSVDVWSGEWDWAEQLATAFQLDGASLFSYFEWVARETGRELIFDSSEVRQVAMANTLHGDIRAMTPEQSLHAVIATSSLASNIDVTDAQIRVRAR